jgi:hypothetical protein
MSKVLSLYTVPPFTTEAYEKRMENFEGDAMSVCSICGKRLKLEGHQFFGLANSDNTWTDPRGEDDSDLGQYPVGNDCHKKYNVPGSQVEIPD